MRKERVTLSPPRLLAELRRVLARPRLRWFVTSDQADRLVEALVRDASIVDDEPDPERVSRDPGDDYLIALARSAKAHVLVTGDADLLEARVPEPAVVSPAEFLRRLPP